MQIQKYAPVLIPTLNRYKHFRRCVESLAGCTHADKTELIVGLDYPPSEKYEEGWRKICEYLPTIAGFKKVTILKRDHNLGAVENMNSLLEYVETCSDRFIFTEDDNEVSPNFLDYINKGLEKYKYNTEVYAICGYNYPIDISDYKQPYYFSHEFAAWGYGSWIEKNKNVSKILKAPNYLIDLYKKYPLNCFFRNNLKLMSLATILGDGYLGDVYKTSYLHSRNIYTVFPKVSKVRNWGHDGSGINCGIMEKELEELYTKQEIDNDTKFDFSSDLTICIDKYTNKKVQTFMKPPFKMIIRRILGFILVRLYAKILK